jgi:hypothetical protein
MSLKMTAVPINNNSHDNSPNKESQHVVGAEVAFKEFLHGIFLRV